MAAQASAMAGPPQMFLLPAEIEDLLEPYLIARAGQVEQHGTARVWRDGGSLTVAEILQEIAAGRNADTGR